MTLERYADFRAVQAEAPAPGVLLLRLNQPRTLNAWSDDMIANVTTALRTAKDDDNVHVIVLTGAGELFSSGADLSGGASMSHGPFRNSPMGVLMWDWLHFTKPIIAAVNGGAVGVGVTLLLHCDIVYACKRAYFMTPFARIALAPEFVSSMILPEIVGPSIANEMLLAGRRLTADEALRARLVSEVYDTPEATVAAAIKMATQMCAFPVAGKTLPLFKGMVRHASRLKDMEAVFNMEASVLDLRRENGETAQGMMEFMRQKRASKL